MPPETTFTKDISVCASLTGILKRWQIPKQSVEITYVVQCPHSNHPPGLSDSETGCTGSPWTTPLCLTAAGLAKVDISVS